MTLRSDQAYGEALLDAPIPTVGSGDSTIVAAPGASKKLVVVGLILSCGAAASVVALRSAATAKVPGLSFAANGGLADRGDRDSPMFACAENEALVLNSSTAGPIGGVVTYFIESSV